MAGWYAPGWSPASRQDKIMYWYRENKLVHKLHYALNHTSLPGLSFLHKNGFIDTTSFVKLTATFSYTKRHLRLYRQFENDMHHSRIFLEDFIVPIDKYQGLKSYFNIMANVLHKIIADDEIYYSLSIEPFYFYSEGMK